MIDAHRVARYNAHKSYGGPVPRRNHSVPKRATNVSVRGDLLTAAREAGVNLSATLERALTSMSTARSLMVCGAFSGSIYGLSEQEPAIEVDLSIPRRRAV
jgi:hypothetical protein